MDQLVPVATDLTIPEGLVARSMLRAYGISADLDAFHYAAMVWHHTQALQGLRVLVPGGEADVAAHLLTGDGLDGAAKVTPDADPPSIAIQVTRALISVAVLALTGVPCPYWLRRNPSPSEPDHD